MSKFVRGAVAAALLFAVAACASSQAQNPDLTPPGRKLDAKTQLECGKRC